MTSQSPAILLVAPQMGENIGAAARVMGNFGLSDLRIIAPRDGWPNPAADTMSAGAFESGVVTARVFETLEEAVSDLNYLIATTARQRGMTKPVYGTARAVEALKSQTATGVLFGAEKSGLPNEAVTLCNAILTYPVNSAFASLNLAQAVGVFAHAWSDAASVEIENEGVEAPAAREELLGMMQHFEDELDTAGFFFPAEKKDVMVQNLRNAFTRADWTTQEVRTFRGAVKALALGRGKARIARGDGT